MGTATQAILGVFRLGAGTPGKAVKPSSEKKHNKTRSLIEDEKKAKGSGTSSGKEPDKNTEEAKNNQSSIKRKGVTKSQTQALYQTQTSFIDHLPWVEALENEQAILLDDNVSVAAIFEVTPRGTEGRTEEFLVDIRNSIVDALQDVFDEFDNAPWVLQTYTFNELELKEFTSKTRKYVDKSAQDTEFSQTYLELLDKHCQSICKNDGLFFDDEVTQTNWSGRIQRNYLVIYRRYGVGFKQQEYEVDTTPIEALNEVCEKLYNALAPLGIKQRRLEGYEFHHWMTRWFNKYTDLSKNDPTSFSNLVQFTDDESMPFGDEFAESLFYSYPRSDQDNKCWWFDSTAMRCITIDGIRKRPSIGHATGETKHGDSINTMFDQLPEGTVMVSTIVMVPQDTVELHIETVSKSAIGDSSDSSRTKQDCTTAKTIMGDRHKLYRAKYAFYVQSQNIEQLNRITNQARSVLLSHGLRAIAIKDDIKALDNFITNLPMKYDADKDRLEGWRQAQLTWVQHIANLSPFFGRSTGTGNPGIVQFNRGGEPLVFDPLNKLDRNKNAHMLLVGPTGAGKSVTLSGILSHVIAIHRPRMFIIEAGNSFGLTAEWYKSLGLTVNIISLKPGSGVTLPTFADAEIVIKQTKVTPTLEEDEYGIEDSSEDEDDDVQRDILGEMEIIATLMITGGEEKEAAMLRRADRRVIRDAILLGAKIATEKGEVTLTEHVREGFYQIAKKDDRPPDARQRIRDMGDAIGLFCDGFAGDVFNKPGMTWPEVDVTLIDLAHFAREGYEAHLAISVISLLNMINNIAERDQNTAREIVVPIDEAHIITTNPLLSPYLVKIVKMWRKLGAWLWLATQNIEDFPGNSKKLLNMIEWWICLVMPKEEIEQIQRFKQLSEEQKNMLLSASKADRKFTEGVVLAKNMDILFRSVPPSLILALSMTEKHEKNERFELMKKHGVDEVEAAHLMAQEIDKARGIQ